MEAFGSGRKGNPESGYNEGVPGSSDNDNGLHDTRHESL